MKSNRCVATLLLAFGFILVAGCDEDPTRPATGFIAVTVTDASGPPVSDVEIRVVPVGLTAMTNPQGVALFELAPGDYFVDANLCCIGPGLIDYHVLVTVTGGETEVVELRSCLVCV